MENDKGFYLRLFHLPKAISCLMKLICFLVSFSLSEILLERSENRSYRKHYPLHWILWEEQENVSKKKKQKKTNNPTQKIPQNLSRFQVMIQSDIYRDMYIAKNKNKRKPGENSEKIGYYGHREKQRFLF